LGKDETPPNHWHLWCGNTMEIIEEWEKMAERSVEMEEGKVGAQERG
jgi:hypothetical protein